MYTCVEYAKKRLEHTLIQTKEGEPFWVDRVFSKGNKQDDVEVALQGLLNAVPLGNPQPPNQFIVGNWWENAPVEVEVEEDNPDDHDDFGEAPLLSNQNDTNPADIICEGRFIENASVISKKKKRTLDTMDLTPVSLGFVNLDDPQTAAFASRAPVRRYWKQGLGEGNLKIVDSRGRKLPFPSLTSLYNTIKNRYPTLRDSFDKATSRGIIVAFHKHFALGEGDLFYKNKKVGKSKGFMLDAKYIYLNEYLQEVLNEEDRRNF